MASSLSNRLSREDHRKAKELDELRKTGAAPPELDEDGKMINPHIPQYVSVSPWYLNSNRPGLKHQYMKHFGTKFETDFAKMGDWYTNKGKFKDGPVAKKFRKGACNNCGAMTHKTKECVERPQRKGAKLRNKTLAKDEIIQEVSLDYDGKRDRWNGYNAVQYQQVINKFNKREAELRRQKAKKMDSKYKKEKTEEDKRKRMVQKHLRKEQKLQAKKKKKAEKKAKLKGEKAAEGEDDDNDTDTDTDTDVDTDTDTDTDNEEESSEEDIDEDMKDSGKMFVSRSAGAKFTTNQTTARNLRIREDTPKYLRNLGANSAYYDPKTRSMRDNPHPDQDPHELMYAGDNFIRKSGDAKNIAALQLFVWENEGKQLGGGGYNEEIHVLANPSQAELLHEQFLKKKESLKVSRKSQILEKYGGGEHMEAPDKTLLLGQSETYLEYSEGGEVIKGIEKLTPKTKYVEDRYEANHKQVWGSFWKDGKWGFACCHITIRSGYCTGSAGKQLEQEKPPEAKRLLPPVPKFGLAAQKAADDDDDNVDLANERVAARMARKKRLSEGKQKKKKKDDDDDDDSSSSSSSSSDSSSDSDKKRKKKKAKKSSSSISTSGVSASPPAKTSAFNKDSFRTDAPSAAEMDEYQRNRHINEDHVF